MTSKEALEKLNFECIRSNGIDDEYSKELKIVENDLEVLDILKKKGVAVGFIQLQIKENCGGVREYNDYIGEDKSLHLTADEYEKIKEWIENGKIDN